MDQAKCHTSKNFDSLLLHNYSDLLLLQQEHVLSELNRHISEYPDSSDSTKKTLLFLEACSSLFEHGFLSSDKVESINCDVMKHITKGYKFFTDWFMKVLEEGIDYRLTISFHFFQILNSKFLTICKEDFYHGRVSHYFKINYLFFIL